MDKRRARFWLLVLPVAATAVVGCLVAAGPNDPFAPFEGDTLERIDAGSGQVRTTRNVHADFRRLADLDTLRESYVASAPPNHDALVLRSRDPRAAIPLIVLRPGRRFEWSGKIAAGSMDVRGLSGAGWTRVETVERAGWVARTGIRLLDALHPRSTTATTFVALDPSSPNGMGVTAYLARRNFTAEAPSQATK